MGLQDIVILGTVAVIIIVFLVIPNRTAYKCPKCGQTFVPRKSQFFGIHSFGSYMLKCPHCGETSMMKPVGKE